jgi:hypothetical protein
MPNFRETPQSVPAQIAIVGSSTFSRFAKISAAYTQNLFESDEWLISYPGYKKTLAPMAPGPGRGLFHSTRSNALVWVVGANVYVVNSNLSVSLVEVGDVPLKSETGEVFMAENLNSQVAIVDGVNAYILTLTPPYSLYIQTDGALAANGGLLPKYVAFHDTYFAFGNGNTTAYGAQWFIYSFNTISSPPNNALITQTEQLELQTKPDYAQAVVPIPGQANNVLVMGTTVSEIQQNVGGLEYYRRNQSVNIDYGCLSVATIARSDNFIVWLAVNEDNSPVITMFSGQQTKAISTDGIDYILGRLQFPQQSTAMFYREIGHLFYQITFYNHADNLTLCYDFTTEKFINLTDHAELHHPALDMVYFNLQTYFLNLQNGGIYAISTDISYIDENTASVGSDLYDTSLVYVIPRTRITNSIRLPTTGRFRVNSLVFMIEQGNDANFTELDLLSTYPNLMVTENTFLPQPNSPIITESGNYMVGEAINTTPAIDGPSELAQYLPPVTIIYRPRVDLTISNDDGITWSNTVSRYMNPVGQRKNIMTFENMGASNDFTLKLRFWSLASIVVGNGDMELY